MELPAKSIALEDLLDHAAWLHRLARQLAGGRADLADDAVQEAWLAALERPPEAWRSPRRWLGQVLRNAVRQRARGEAARRARERTIARPESFDSAAVAVERAQALRVLVQALIELDEPYRSTLLMRYQDGFSAAEIARALCVPASTVRNRLSRGLAILRERLERRGGAELRLVLAPLLAGAWSRAGVPQAAAGVSSATLPVLVSSFAMSKLVSWTAAALALAALVWWAWPEPAPLQQLASVPASAAPDPELARLDATSPQESSRVALDEPSRVESAPVANALASSPSTASLEVHVTRAADGSPAEGVRVFVAPAEGLDIYFPELARACDSRGIARFDELAPGRFSVVDDRGDGVWAELEAGDETRIEFEVPLGIEVQGRVVDRDQRGVANARIWLSAYGNSGEGFEVATSDAAGFFRVQDVGPARTIAARAEGRAPSLQRDVPGHPGEKVELTLRIPEPGGALEGLVRAPDGTPAARARVVVGRGPYGVRDPDGARLTSPPPFRVRTDDEGRFRVDGVAPGTVPVEARSGAHAPWSTLAEISVGRTTFVAIDLALGASVEGLVLDAEGRPASKVAIACGPYGQFSSSSTKSGDDGTFALRGLSSGELDLFASGNTRGAARTRIFVAPGASARWDARLELEGGSVGGRIVDDGGHALASWRVGAVALDQPGLQQRSAISDADGRFLIENWPKDAQALEVREQFRWTGPSALFVRDVPIGRRDLELVVPRAAMATAYVIGRVLGPDEKPVPGATLNWREAGAEQSFREDAKVETGEFRLGPQPAGRYRFDVSAPGFGSRPIGERDLAADSTLELGTIALETAGRVRVVLEPAEQVELESSTFCMLYDDSGAWVHSLEIDDGEGLSEPLAPGGYQVRFGGWSTRADAARVAVLSGETALARMRVERGSWRTLELRCEDGATPRAGAELTLVDASGEIVWQQRVWAPDGERSLVRLNALKPGSYSVAVVASDGRSASARFDVDALGPPDASEPPIELWLR